MKTIFIIVAVALLLQCSTQTDARFVEGLLDFHNLPFGAAFGGQASESLSANVEAIDVFGSEISNNFNVLEQFATLFGSGTEALTRSVSNLISARVQSIANYGRVLLSYIAALRDEIEFSGVQVEFRTLERNLRSISNEADKFSSMLVDLRETKTKQINEEENSQADRAAEWSSLLLERLDTRTNDNEWARNKAESLINEFIQRHFDLQASCKEEALTEVDDLERNAQRPLEQIEKIEQDMVSKLRACATSTNNRVQQRRCQRDINVISTKLVKASRDLRQLQISATSLNNPRQQYKNRDCVKDIFLDYSLEQFSIELQVEDLISQASSHPNSSNANQSENESQEQSNQSSSQTSQDQSSQGEQSQGQSNESASQSGQTEEQSNQSSNQSSSQSGQTEEQSNQSSSQTLQD